MAFHRKLDAIRPLNPDIAVISETAAPDVLASRGITEFNETTVQWMGKNRNKGLGIFAFKQYRLRPHPDFVPWLRFCLPVYVDGPVRLNLLGVWAQNANEGNRRKHQLGHLSRAMSRYQHFLMGGSAILAGDLNNNTFWDRPGYRMNHETMVQKANRMGLQSLYHSTRQEAHGKESTPTHYWRDRKKDGPTYHIDYIFGPTAWADTARISVGTYEDWCGNGLSDHVPLILDIPDENPAGKLSLSHLSAER